MGCPVTGDTFPKKEMLELHFFYSKNLCFGVFCSNYRKRFQASNSYVIFQIMADIKMIDLRDNSPFYSCVLSDLAFEWKQGWS